MGLVLDFLVVGVLLLFGDGLLVILVSIIGLFFRFFDFFVFDVVFNDFFLFRDNVINFLVIVKNTEKFIQCFFRALHWKQCVCFLFVCIKFVRHGLLSFVVFFFDE